MHCQFREKRPQSFSGTVSDLRPPEFETEVRRRARAHPAVCADLAHFGNRAESLSGSFAVERCEIGGGDRVWLSLLLPERPVEVRPGDVFFDGALFTADLKTGHVRVACRLVRLVCRNGAVLPEHSALGSEVYERFPDGGAVGDLERVVERAFSFEVVHRAAGLLGRAALVPAESMGHALAWMRLSGRVRLPARAHEAFVEEGEPTLYGAWNAVTRTARDAGTLREREALERLGGEMVSRLFGVATGVSQPA